MKAGVGIDDRLELSRSQQHALVKEAARLGYDSLWTPASAAGRSSLFTCLDWWQVSGLEVGISVVPFPAWTAPSLGVQAATVGELTGGKFALGIGLGGYDAPAFRRSLGVPDFPTVAYTRDFLSVLVGLLRGETVSYAGRTLSIQGLKLGFDAPKVPVYLAALGPRMLALAAELADGVTPNWSSADEIARMRGLVATAAPRGAGLLFAQYIRVCIDEDEDAARRAFALNMLGYAMARPGQPKDRGYRAHFARMGFSEVLDDLEARRDVGTSMAALVDLIPAELLLRVGYFGRPDGAAAALRRLSAGLDEAMVRLISARPGSLEHALAAVRACQPSGWRGDS